MKCISKNNRKERCKNKANWKYFFHCHAHRPSSIKIFFILFFTIIPGLITIHTLQDNSETSEKLEAIEKYVQSQPKQRIDRHFDIKKETGFTLEQLITFSKNIDSYTLSHIEQGNVYLILGKIDKAIEEFTSAISLKNGENGEALFLRGIAYSLLGSLNINYSSPIVDIRRNLNPFSALSLSKANKDFKASLSLGYKVGLNYIALGDSYSLTSDYKLALYYLNKSIKYYPNFPEIYNLVSNIYVDIWKLSKSDKSMLLKAAQKTRLAIKMSPNDYLYYNNHSATLNYLEEYSKSIDTASIAISLNPNYELSYGTRGLAYLQLKEYDKAFNDYNFIITKLNPLNSRAYLGRSRANRGLGKINLAIKDSIIHLNYLKNKSQGNF